MDWKWRKGNILLWRNTWLWHPCASWVYASSNDPCEAAAAYWTERKSFCICHKLEFETWEGKCTKVNLLCIYLLLIFYFRGRKMGRRRSFIYWWTPQVLATSKDWVKLKQEAWKFNPGVRNRWRDSTARAIICYLPWCTLTGSKIGSRVAGVQCRQMGCEYFKRWLNCCAKCPASQNFCVGLKWDHLCLFHIKYLSLWMDWVGGNFPGWHFCTSKFCICCKRR